MRRMSGLGLDPEKLEKFDKTEKQEAESESVLLINDRPPSIANMDDPYGSPKSGKFRLKTQDNLDHSFDEESLSDLKIQFVSNTPKPITAWSLDIAYSSKLVRYKKSKKTFFDPFNPSKNPPRLSAYRRRWSHAIMVSASTASGVTLFFFFFFFFNFLILLLDF